MAKKLHILFGLAFMALLMHGCGEDRSGEYYALTEQNQWIYQQMNQYYLWYDRMPAPTRNDYFGDAEDFFDDLLLSTDKYSYFEPLEESATKSIDYTSTYGFDFALYVDPLQNTSKVYARILLVLPGSSAGDAGLQRGDWISSVNGTLLTQNNYGYLMEGDSAALQTVTIIPDTAAGSYVWEDGPVLQLAPSTAVTLDPFYIDSIYNIGGTKIAYLVYNRFTPGPGYEADETEYNVRMNSIFSRYKQAGIDALILDLRFNTGGFLTCAQQLASLIVPTNAFGHTFCSLEFNDKNSSKNMTYLYEDSLTGGANLNLYRLYVITSDYTASASEAVIYDLRATMGDDNVITLGTTTEGKNLASIALQTTYPFILHPIVATVYNSNGESDYSNGIPPTYQIEELSYINTLRPLGDTDELLLYSTLQLILNGTVPDFSPPARHSIQGKKKVLFQSLSTQESATLFR